MEYKYDILTIMYDPDRITYLAETDYRDKRIRFGIKAKDRTKHFYAIGKTGMGKSNLLEVMAIQDIQNGEGLAFVDPHGKSADLLLDFIPKERIDDLMYFAPFDMDYPIGFNVLEDVGHERRHLVSSGLLNAFKKIWGPETFSSRMEYILGNTLMALLEFPGATLLGVNRMLVDKHYRKLVVDNVTDPSVKSYWVDEFAKYTERFAAEATPAIQNKIGQFTSNPIIRNIIGQPRPSFDFREMMDNKKIVIINLSKGQIGEENARLLGSMLITKIYLAAMSRADLSPRDLEKLPNFYLYVDEFQSFANESFADILSEARKYKLNLTIAHQYIEQMSEEVRAAVFGNVGTMVTFRVGAFDAETLEKEYAPQYEAEDLVNLGKYQVAIKLMVNGVASAPFSAVPLPPFPMPSISYRDVAVESSRKKYAHPRSEIEAEILEWHNVNYAPKKSGSGSKEAKDGKDGGEGSNKKGGSMTYGSRPRELIVKKTPEEREKDIRKAMTLDHLKDKASPEGRRKKKKKPHAPSEVHMNDLKSALASVLESAQKSSQPQSKEPERKPVQAKHPEAVSEPLKRAEISEEQLRAALKNPEKK